MVENNIVDVPPIAASPVANKEKQHEKPRFTKLKNFLLTFFIVEHVVLFVLLLVPVFFFVRTYASSDYAALNQKASSFTPQSSDEVLRKYMNKYQSYFVDFVRPENEFPTFDISIEENDLNALVADLELDHVEKVYIEPNDDNNVLVWVKTNKFPYPVVFKIKLDYNYNNKIFKLDLLSWSVGPLAFPPDILNFAEDTINQGLWDGLLSANTSKHFHIEKINTAKGELNVSLKIDDKVKFTESFFTQTNQ